MRFAIAVGIAYFLAAWLGLALPTKPENAAAFWPAAGIAVGALIALGREARPQILFGVISASLAANLTGGRSFGTSVAFSLCNALGALVTALLVELWFGPELRLEDVRSVLGLFVAVALGSAVAATGAALGIRFFDHSVTPLLNVWRVWFIADVLGIITVAPLLIGLAPASRERPPRREVVEATAALGVLLAWMGLEFTVPSRHWAAAVPEDLLFPLVLWVAARCRPVFAAGVVFLLAIAVAASLTYGVGPFGNPAIAVDDRVFAAQVALLAVTLSALILAALFAERRRKEATLQASTEQLRSALDSAKKAEFELQASNRLLDSVIENLPAMVFMKRASDLRFSRFNRAGEKLLGYSRSELLGKTDYDIYPKEQADFFTAVDRDALASGDVREIREEPIRIRDGTTRYLRTSKIVLYDASGAPTHLLGVSIDITKRKEGEERIKLLMREISHRAKNLLAIVQVMARHTAEEVEPKLFAERFGQRIAGLAASHDLLVKSDWRGVDIADLVRSQLAHIGNLAASRITLCGPPLGLGPSAAQTIGMVLHELAANAVKYGALSNDRGTVRIEWDIVGSGRDARFKMRWLEQGGPPPRPPQRRGFGHTVMVDIVEHALDAEVHLRYPSSGLNWEMTASVEWTLQPGALLALDEAV